MPKKDSKDMGTEDDYEPLKKVIPGPRKPSLSGKGAILVSIGIVALLILTIIVSASVVIVPAGYKGVIVSSPSGPDYNEIDEGWHINPYYLFCKIVLVRYNTQQMSFVGADEAGDSQGSIDVSSSDNLAVEMDFSIMYHIQADKVADLTIEAGDYKDSIMIPICRSVPRDAAARYTALEMRGEKRGDIEVEIGSEITRRLAEKHIVVESFAMRSIRLPDTVEKAIEEKKAAEQQMIAANYTREKEIIEADAERQSAIIRAEGTAQSTIVEANGSAEAVRIIMDSLNVTGNESVLLQAYLQYLFIQALQNPDSNVQFVIVPSDGQSLIINLNNNGTAG